MENGKYYFTMGISWVYCREYLHSQKEEHPGSWWRLEGLVVLGLVHSFWGLGLRVSMRCGGLGFKTKGLGVHGVPGYSWGSDFSGFQTSCGDSWPRNDTGFQL